MNDEEPIPSNAGDEQAFRLAYLIAGFIQHTLTQAEDEELDDWVTASLDNQLLFEKLLDEKDSPRWHEHLRNTDTGAALKRVKSKLIFEPVKNKDSFRNIWMYAAAAAVIIAVVVTFLTNTNHVTQPSTTMATVSATGDIAPGKAMATLTLADGTVIGLDSIKQGRVLAQQHSNVIKTDSGQLAYQEVGRGLMAQTEIFNTLTVPAGGQYQVVLPDGTRVWLNASSSLTYPTVFGGAKRKVTLTGEGYFEVFKDAMFPFEVSANGSTVHVLGTHFNVNAYTDEPVVSVVLAEGSVKLNNSTLLKPGEEGKVISNGNIQKSPADLQAALAWKNGQFLFRQAPIDVLMRQVARWYNAGIIYDVKPSDHFNAAIPRDVPVSKLLHILEKTGSVHFKIEGNSITVMK